jgi:hypothetical protein
MRVRLPRLEALGVDIFWLMPVQPIGTYQRLGTPGESTDWFSGTRVSLAAQGSVDIPAHGCRVLVR